MARSMWRAVAIVSTQTRTGRWVGPSEAHGVDAGFRYGGSIHRHRTDRRARAAISPQASAVSAAKPRRAAGWTIRITSAIPTTRDPLTPWFWEKPRTSARRCEEVKSMCGEHQVPARHHRPRQSTPRRRNGRATLEKMPLFSDARRGRPSPAPFAWFSYRPSTTMTDRSVRCQLVRCRLPAEPPVQRSPRRRRGSRRIGIDARSPPWAIDCSRALVPRSPAPASRPTPHPPARSSPPGRGAPRDRPPGAGPESVLV